MQLRPWGVICYHIIRATSFSFKLTFEEYPVILYCPGLSLAPRQYRNRGDRIRWECVIPGPRTLYLYLFIFFTIPLKRRQLTSLCGCVPPSGEGTGTLPVVPYGDNEPLLTFRELHAGNTDFPQNRLGQFPDQTPWLSSHLLSTSTQVICGPNFQEDGSSSVTQPS